MKTNIRAVKFIISLTTIMAGRDLAFFQKDLAEMAYYRSIVRYKDEPRALKIRQELQLIHESIDKINRLPESYESKQALASLIKRRDPLIEEINRLVDHKQTKNAREREMGASVATM